MKELLNRVKGNIRVTKVVATRSVKGKFGDYFAGFAAGWDSVQDEPAGIGKDLEPLVSDDAVATNGMTLKEARVAHYLVSMHADIAAHEAAMASGGISPKQCTDSVASIKINYGKLIRKCLLKDDEAPASAE